MQGPGQVANNIFSSNDSSPRFALTLSQFLNNNSQGGSKVSMGNLLTLPVGGGVLYVQPIYVQASSGTSAYPQSKAIVASFGDKLAWSDTLDGALDGLFGGNSGATAGDQGTSGPAAPTAPSTPTPGQSPGTPQGNQGNAEVAKQLTAAQEAMKAADEALAKGDFTAYGEAQKRVRAAVDAALKAQRPGQTTVVPASPSATPEVAGSNPAPATNLARDSIRIPGQKHVWAVIAPRLSRRQALRLARSAASPRHGRANDEGTRVGFRALSSRGQVPLPGPDSRPGADRAGADPHPRTELLVVHAGVQGGREPAPVPQVGVGLPVAEEHDGAGALGRGAPVGVAVVPAPGGPPREPAPPPASP